MTTRHIVPSPLAAGNQPAPGDFSRLLAAFLQQDTAGLTVDELYQLRGILTDLQQEIDAGSLPPHGRPRPAAPGSPHQLHVITLPEHLRQSNDQQQTATVIYDAGTCEFGIYVAFNGTQPAGADRQHWYARVENWLEANRGAIYARYPKQQQ